MTVTSSVHHTTEHLSAVDVIQRIMRVRLRQRKLVQSKIDLFRLEIILSLQASNDCGDMNRESFFFDSEKK